MISVAGKLVVDFRCGIVLEITGKSLCIEDAA